MLIQQNTAVANHKIPSREADKISQVKILCGNEKGEKKKSFLHLLCACVTSISNGKTEVSESRILASFSYFLQQA